MPGLKAQRQAWHRCLKYPFDPDFEHILLGTSLIKVGKP
jgi:hypothetical protein